MTAARLVGLLALSASAAAQAGLVEIEWDQSQRYQKRLSVDARGFTELCGRLTKGARVEWRFEASGPISFNVHYHAGKEVIFPAKEEGSVRSTGTFEVAVPQDYCWMWVSKGSLPVSVTVELSKRP